MEDAHLEVVVKDVLVDAQNLPFILGEDDSKPGPGSLEKWDKLNIAVFYVPSDQKRGKGHYALALEGKERYGEDIALFDGLDSQDLATLANFLDVARIAVDAGVNSVDIGQDIDDGLIAIDCIEMDGSAFVVMTVRVSCEREDPGISARMTYYLTPKQATFLATSCRTVADIVRRDEGRSF